MCIATLVCMCTPGGNATGNMTERAPKARLCFWRRTTGGPGPRSQGGGKLASFLARAGHVFPKRKPCPRPLLRETQRSVPCIRAPRGTSGYFHGLPLILAWYFAKVPCLSEPARVPEGKVRYPGTRQPAKGAVSHPHSDFVRSPSTGGCRRRLSRGRTSTHLTTPGTVRYGTEYRCYYTPGQKAWAWSMPAWLFTLTAIRQAFPFSGQHR